MRIIILLIILSSPIIVSAQTPFWQQTNGPSGGSSQFAFNSKGDIFNLGRYVLRSTDDGLSWQNITPDFFSGSGSLNGWAISSHDDLYLSLDSSVYRSRDNGVSWSVVLKNIPYGWLVASKTGPMYVEHPNGTRFMWRSTDDGDTWTNLSLTMPSTIQGNFYATSTGKIIFLDYETTHFYFSTNNGNSWVDQSTIPFRLGDIQGTANGYLFCGYALSNTATDVFHGYTIRSTDNGVTWDSINKGTDLIISSNNILLETISPDTIQFSTDYGNTWNLTTMLPDSKALCDYYYNSVDQKENIYWSLADRASRYNTVTKTVQEISVPIENVGNLLIDKNGSIISQGYISFSVSTDKGQSWSTQTGLEDSLYCGKFYAFAHDSSGGIIALGHSDFFRSTDDGKTWLDVFQLIIEHLPNGYLSANTIVTAPNGNIFICDVDYNIMRSSDLGKTWDINVASGLPNGVSAIACDSSGVLYTFFGQAIYRSIDNGGSWQFMINIISPFLYKHIVTTSNVTCIIVTTKGEIFAGTGQDGIIISTDQGITWNVINEHLDSARVAALFAAPNGDVYGIAYGSSLQDGLIYRPYHGTRWYNANDGLGNTDDLQTMAFASDGTAYLGTRGRGVWRSQGVVNAVRQTDNIINKVSLHILQSPASAYATITYSLPERIFTKLDLCDALGRTLLTLTNGIMDAGEHSVNAAFDNISNGMYFIRLTTEKGNAVEKIVINK